MRRDRWYLARLLWVIIIVVVAAGPLLMPLFELLGAPTAWRAWLEVDRIFVLLLHTLGIALGSSLLALLLGCPTAFLLARTSLACRIVWIILICLALFIPLPMQLSGWYLVLQKGGAPLPALWSIEARWLGTMLLHACIGLPWVILIVSLGLLWVEPELEEEMLLYSSFSRVFRHVLLPRLWPCISLAILIVSWPAWHEITVTDFFKVRTLAEEVYLQLNGGSMEDAPRALAVALPWTMLLMLFTGWMMQCWQKQLPAVWPSLAKQRRLHLGQRQWLAQLWMLALISFLVLIPIVGLILRAGMEYGTEPHWSAYSLLVRMKHSIKQTTSPLGQSLLMATIAGGITAFSTLLLVWLSRNSSRIQQTSWWLAAALWAMPGPLLGLGLLSYIQWLIQLPGGSILSPWLYSEPSPVPNIWIACLRFFPLVWLILWPMAMLLPRRLEETSWLEGATPWERFCLHYWPVLWKPALVLMLGVTLLTLGEISASKLVTTPGFLPLSHHLFQLIHAGADTEVAAISLTLLLPALTCAAGCLMINLIRQWK